jgi:hypothetical protein
MEFQPNRRSVELSIVQERGRTPRACKIDRAAQFLIGDRLLTDLSAGNFLQARRGQRTPQIARYGAMRSDNDGLRLSPPPLHRRQTARSGCRKHAKAGQHDEADPRDQIVSSYGWPNLKPSHSHSAWQGSEVRLSARSHPELSTRSVAQAQVSAQSLNEVMSTIDIPKLN